MSNEQFTPNIHFLPTQLRAYERSGEKYKPFCELYSQVSLKQVPSYLGLGLGLGLFGLLQLSDELLEFFGGGQDTFIQFYINQGTTRGFIYLFCRYLFKVVAE